jgi:hypothetical protein
MLHIRGDGSSRGRFATPAKTSLPKLGHGEQNATGVEEATARALEPRQHLTS